MDKLCRTLSAALLCCLFFQNAQAFPLIKEDKSVIITDTNTHLQWLMLTESNWMNYAQQDALRSSFAGGGWEWASGEQVDTLAGYFGIDLGFSGSGVHTHIHPDGDEPGNITAFTAMFGDTVGEDGAITDPANDYIGVLGRIAGTAGGGMNYVMGAYLFDNEPFDHGWYTANYYGEESMAITESNFRPAYGAWLYRTVPEPETLALFLLGLGGLALGRRKRLVRK
jgi:hypothetical protein